MMGRLHRSQVQAVVAVVVVWLVVVVVMLVGSAAVISGSMVPLVVAANALAALGVSASFRECQAGAARADEDEVGGLCSGKTSWSRGSPARCRGRGPRLQVLPTPPPPIHTASRC